ncbi:SpnB-like Rossmann fold domain-containing protein, partial [Streptomyces yokosukanensis]|uniref:SpnB-like Rossmann fold domain-containing protein n=1 Tax=Streptomyces yokosukanensis TaxID=67386 RepID=UPI003CC56ED8
LFRVEWTAVAAAGSFDDWLLLGEGAQVFADLAGLGVAVVEGGEVPAALVVPCTEVAEGDVAAGVHESTGRVLGLLKEWLADERFAQSRLVFLTRGAVAARSGEGVSDLVHAAVRGLVRSAQSENPGRIVLVDVDVDGDVREGVSAALASGESEVAVREGVVLVPRLARAAV